MIGDLMNFISEAVTGFISIFVDLFSDTGIITVFWDATTGVTMLGGLLLLAFSLGLVMWAFNFVRRLIKMR